MLDGEGMREESRVEFTTACVKHRKGHILVASGSRKQSSSKSSNANVVQVRVGDPHDVSAVQHARSANGLYDFHNINALSAQNLPARRGPAR